MERSVHSLFGFIVLCASLVSVTSCTRPSPVSPTPPMPTVGRTGEATLPASPVPSVKGRHAISGAVVFPVLAGVFTIENGSGDGIAGTYTGGAQFADGGVEKTSLTLQVSNGSGAFARATGAVAINGVGSFADAGTFVLDGSGEVTLAGGKRAIVVLSLRGRSVTSCDASARIAIAQTADGTMARAGRVAARLSHVVGNTGCSP
jgi:hypothetical protein